VSPDPQDLASSLEDKRTAKDGIADFAADLADHD